MGGKNCSGELTNPGGRWAAGGRLLQQRAENSRFRVEHMMEVLRDTNSGINRPAGDFPTAGSQVSILGKQGGLNIYFYFFQFPSHSDWLGLPCHWFTGSASPSK